MLFLNDKVTKAFKPFVRLKKNTLLISQLTLDETPLKVELFYKGELILSDELKGNQILERAYRLSKDVRGDYFLKLKFGDRYFSEAFEL